MTRLLMCLAMSWTIVLGSLVEKSSDAEQHDTIPKSTEAFKADLDKRGKRTLVIGEGHATQVNGCCVLVQVGEAWGNLDLPTPAYENHTNLDAVTIDADQSNPDYRGCFRSNTPLPNAYFDRVIDARAIFNKGVILERDVQKLMDTNEGELRLIYNALNPSGVFEFQYDASFDVRGLGDRMSQPPNHLEPVFIVNKDALKES